MDNNQNNIFSGQPEQPQPQTSPFGQPQGGSPFGNQSAPKKPMNISFGLIAMICGAVSLVMAIIGSIFVCTCSASKTWSTDSMVEIMLSALGGSLNTDIHSTSAVIVVNIIAAVIAAAAVVLAIIGLKKNTNDKMSKIAIAISTFAFFYAILPVLTICGYNCSLNKNMSNSMSSDLF